MHSDDSQKIHECEQVNVANHLIVNRPLFYLSGILQLVIVYKTEMFYKRIILRNR